MNIDLIIVINIIIFIIILFIIVTKSVIINKKQSIFIKKQNDKLLVIASIINHDLKNSIENIEFASNELTRMVKNDDFDIIDEVEEILRLSSLQQLQRLKSVMILMKNLNNITPINKSSENLLENLSKLIETEGYSEKIILDQSLNLNIDLNLELFGVISDNLIKNAFTHNDSLNKILNIYVINNYLIFEDNARKFPIKDFNYLKKYNTKGKDSIGSGQGLYIISSSISILGWKLEIENTNNGNKFKIKFK